MFAHFFTTKAYALNGPSLDEYMGFGSTVNHYIECTIASKVSIQNLLMKAITSSSLTTISSKHFSLNLVGSSYHFYAIILVLTTSELFQSLFMFPNPP